MAEVYDALTDGHGIEVASRHRDLSFPNPKPAEFAKGLENASLWTLASSGDLNSEKLLPFYEEARRSAAKEGHQDDQEFIMEFLFQKLFYEPLHERFSFDAIDISSEGIPDDHSEVFLQEEAVVLPLPALVKKRLHPGAVAVSDPGAKYRSPLKAGRDDTPTSPERSESEETRNRQRATDAATMARISALQGELEKLRRDRDSWLSKAQSAQAKSDELLRQVARLEADLESRQVECYSLETASAAERATADDLRQRLSSMSKELERLRDQRDTLVGKAEAAETAATDLRQRSANLEATLNELSIERDHLIEKARSGERIMQDNAAEERALHREIAINLIVALVFLTAVLVLLLYKGQVY